MTKPTPDVPVEGGGNYFLAVLDHYSRKDPSYQQRNYHIWTSGGEFQGTPSFSDPAYGGLLKQGVLLFNTTYIQLSQISAVRIG